MSAKQREAILVFVDLFDGDLPPQNRVALRAIRAHLSLVDIGVTIRAVLADIGKDRLDVALDAFHFGVHAPQRVCGAVVVKFGNRADGAPGSRGMAVFAGNGQRAVRAPGIVSLPKRARSRNRRRNKEQPTADDVPGSNRNRPHPPTIGGEKSPG